jgi:hypothetical protein
LVVFLFGFCGAQAQYFKISGKITNDKLEPLALVSIQVKDQLKELFQKKMAVMSYILKKEPMILLQHVGYKTLLINLVVSGIMYRILSWKRMKQKIFLRWL